jgi:hypothetical protein
MRDLSQEEKETLARRRAKFPEFVASIVPGIGELAEFIRYEQATAAADRPEDFLPFLEAFVAEANLEPLSRDQMLWLNTRLGYFIIELLVHRHGGHPMLQVSPDDDFFLHYVVGEFDDGTPRNVIIEPFAVGYSVTKQPPGRSLVRAIDRLHLGPRT